MENTFLSVVDKARALVKDKRGVLIAAALLVCAAAALLLLGKKEGGTAIEIDAQVWPAENRVEVRQRIDYRNATGAALEDLLLHLYPLAYASAETAPVAEGDFGVAYPRGFSAGGAQIDGITVDGAPANGFCEGTAVRIPLPKALENGDSAAVELSYSLSVPDSRARFGGGEHSINLLNAFAVPAVYDSSGWRSDPYGPIGDPFFSECADYTASITVPSGYAIAATGTRTGEKTREERVTYTFSAPNAREFAAVLSEDYHTTETKVGDVTVRSHAPTQQGADAALSIAAQAAASMSAAYGDCIYREIEVCSADIMTGGMEYPGLAVIGVALYDEGQEGALEYCIAHEVAHQWWYGAVGSDQINAPWMDESLAEYATLLYYEDTYGAEGFQSAYRKFIRPRLLTKGLASIPLERSIDSFDSPEEYASVVYAKGAAMWHALRLDMGDEAFFDALRGYYADNKLSIAHKQDLYDAFGADASALIEEWLTGRAP